MRRSFSLRTLTACALVAFLPAACLPDSVPSAAGMDQSVGSLRGKIDHIVVIFQENWSFDGQYGKFPGANGIANATGATQTQVYCKSGSTAYTTLSRLPRAYMNAPNANGCSWNAAQSGTQVDDRIPEAGAKPDEALVV